MAPVTRGKGRAVPPADPSRLPRVKLVVRRKRPVTPPAVELPAAETDDLDLTEAVPSPSEMRKMKKAKREIPAVRFLLTLLVVFGKKLLVNETELKTPGAFNYQDFTSQEAKAVGLHAVRKKLDLERLHGRATIRYGVEKKPVGRAAGKSGVAKSAKGVGGEVTRTVDGPEDWEKVEAVATEWVSRGKKDVRIELRVEYRVPCEGEDDDSDDCDSEELATPSTTHQKTRRTATVIMQEEMEKQQRAEKCYIPGLMRRWRCQNKMCKQYPDNACLVLAHEKQCRPLNAHVLGIWDARIKKGESTEHSFPCDIKMPPMANEKSTKPTLNTTSVSGPPSMQISVTAPPPQLPPWWLSAPNTHLVPSANLPASTTSGSYFSSPIRITGASSTQLLNSFIEWFKGTLTPGHEAIEAVERAYIELKKEMYDLEGVRAMDGAGWKELKVPVGLGHRMSKAVKEFKSKQD